ncbi:MAG: HAD-IIIA family hydrolase [Rhodospirillales bacterium]
MTANSFPIDDDGVWIEIADRYRWPDRRPRAALFLDRDGVIVEDTGYLRRETDVQLIAGAADVIARANRLNLPVIVVSNQSGIGRGLFDWPTFSRVQTQIEGLLATAASARIDAVLACPHHRLAARPYTHPDAPWRKPNPGMLLKAAAQMSIDLARSWIVGDRAGDLLAGRRAGLAGGVHVATGEGRHDGERQRSIALAGEGYRVAGAASLLDAAEHIPLFTR